MKKKILITWGLGYIGSHAVVAFEEAWYETVILDNLSNSCLSNLRMITNTLWYTPKYYEYDLRDKKSIFEMFEENQFQGVIHFAWLKSPFESQDKPIYYFENNISWSIVLFEAMDYFKVKNIVFSSSANTYHSNNVLPIKETDLQRPTNPYGTTKLLLEKILEDLSQFSGFNVINLRYFNPIWAHPSGKLGEDPEGIPNNLFPFIFKVLTGELDQLKVFGWDYNTHDWTWIRDFIDVNDLVYAHILAYWKIEENNDRWYCNTFNVGTWNGISVLDAINAVEQWLWLKVNYKIVEKRNWDIPISFCDTSKIEKELWFKANTSIKESVKNSWKFYNK